MNNQSDNDRELEEAISDFVSIFELVFDNDWEKTKSSITDSSYVTEDGGTFIHPGVVDESNNWWNRGSLLSSYRRLLEVMERHDIPHGIDYNSSSVDSDF